MEDTYSIGVKIAAAIAAAALAAVFAFLFAREFFKPRVNFFKLLGHLFGVAAPAVVYGVFIAFSTFTK